MTAVTLKHFGGMVPKLPPEELPEGAAAFANNCDFNLGVLGGVRDGLDIWGRNPNGSGPVKGMFTYNGTHWYTWDTAVQAYKGPVVNDSFKRIYYLENAVLYAAFLPENFFDSYKYGGKPTLPGSPSAKVLVGVPNPTAAPVLSVIDRNTLADYPLADIWWKYWWTDGIDRWGETSFEPSPVLMFRRYTFDQPSPPAGVIPEGTTATLVVGMTLINDQTNASPEFLCSLNTASNSKIPATSSALPGGLELTLTLGTPNVLNITWGVTETRAYVFTVTNDWNEESGPSPAAIISPTYMQDVQVATFNPPFVTPNVAPTYGAPYKSYSKTTIYRTFGTQTYLKTGATLYSGAQTGTPVYLDSARTVTNVGTALISLDWVPPPVWLEGFVACPNGWFAAFRDNILYMSEPYRPHTWQYSMTFPVAITGICSGPQSLVVATKSAFYYVMGPHPASVNQIELDVAVGGVSQGSMTKVTGGVAALTNDGILLIQGSMASLETSQRYWTREIWQAKYGVFLHTAQMFLSFHDGNIVCASNQNPIGFMLNLNTGALTEFESAATRVYNCLMRLPLEDALYTAISDGSLIRILRFGAGTTYLDSSWASKENIFPQYVKFGAGFARLSGSGSIRIELWADGVRLTWITLAGSWDGTSTGQYFRFPPHCGSLRWQIQMALFGGVRLRELALAQDYSELRSV